MANVGNVTANFTAKVGGFTVPVATLKKTLAGLKKELANVNAAIQLEEQSFREGRDAGNQYSGIIRHLRQQHASLTAQINATNQALGTALPKAARRAVRGPNGLTMVRSGMAQAAVMSLHTKSAFGQVAQGLILLGPGSTAVIAAAAGIAAVALAHGQLTKKAKEAKKAEDELRESLRKSFLAEQQRLNPAGGPQGSERAAALRAMQNIATTIAAQGVPATPAQMEALTAATLRYAAAQHAVVTGLEDLKGEMKDPFLAKFAAAQDALTRAGRDLTEQGRELNKVWSAGLRIIQSQRTPMEVFTDQMRALREAFFTPGSGITEDQYRETIERLKKGLRDALQRNSVGEEVTDELTDTFRDDLRAVGERGGLTLVRGLMQGVFNNATSLADALKRVFLDIMESIAAAIAARFIVPGILDFLGLGLPGLGGGGGGGGASKFTGFSWSQAGNLAAGPTGANSMQLDFSGLNRHPSPQVLARDREWLRTLRASNLELARQGG